MNAARLESLNGMIERITNKFNNTKKIGNGILENHHKECEREEFLTKKITKADL